MRLPYAASLLATLLAPAVARAVPPDFDGERGLEAWIAGGYGSFTANTVRQYETAHDAMIMAGSNPGFAYPEAYSGGFNGRVGVGYRIFPLLSIGGSASLQTLAADNVSTVTASFPAAAGAWSAGVYARFYPMPLITGSLRQRRVRFDGWTLRRLDPWVSLGLEYASLWRSETDATLPPPSIGAAWTRGAVAVPIAVGFDVRVLPALAVGVTVGVAPTIGASTNLDLTFPPTASMTTTHISSTFDAADAVNLAWNVGLGLRYTFTPP